MQDRFIGVKSDIGPDGIRRYSGQANHNKVCYRVPSCQCCPLGGSLSTGHGFFFGVDGKIRCAKLVDDLREVLGQSRVNFDAQGNRIRQTTPRR